MEYFADWNIASTPGAANVIHVVTPHTDTPRDAFDLILWRVNVVIVFALVSVSLVAWGGTLECANSMRGMVMGIGQIGYRNHGSMGAVEFLAMWIAMMAAMMLPTIAPMVVAHHAVAGRRMEGALSTLAFVAGYLLLWSAIGIVVFLAYAVFVQWGDDEVQSLWPLTLAGEVLVLAGAYQFTRWKQVCADVCRRPLAFVHTHDYRRGVRNALRAGTIHGVYCLGCCFAAMTVLVVVGLTNLVWMAILSVLFFLEKNLTVRYAVAKVTGYLLILLGVAVLAYPPLLAGISN